MRSRPNNFKNPLTPTITSPVGVDAIIQAIQIAYADQLSWMEASFGRAFKMARKTDNERYSNLLSRQDYIYPGLWQGDGIDMIDGFANDNLNAYSFFVKEGSSTPLLYEEHIKNTWQVTIANIIWVDLKRVDPTKNYLYSEELLEEIKSVISSVRFSGFGSVEILEVQEDINDVFAGYSIYLAETQNLGYPKHGFKITMNAIYTESCV